MNINLDNDTVLYTTAILLQAGILTFFLIRSRKKKQNKATATPLADEDSYEYNRNTSLQVQPQHLGLTIQPSVTRVYGVVMDWDMGGTTLTLCGYITGATNAFLSSGSAIKGVGANPAIAEQASDFVQTAQGYLGKCMPVSDTGLPLPGTVRFYLLTNKGIFAAQEQLSMIDDNTSPWLGLFFKGTMLLDEIKKSPTAAS